jgi:N-acyl-D-aspartate/D-glutamate deacylase
MQYDLIVRNGTLIDGTGALRRVTDVAVKGGRIAKIGGLKAATADREIDAAGQIVAPGVIDVHTHYDTQINWDPYATSSSWHGTTTVVMANCGFGYAPCRAEHRERNMLMMLNTEQIPLETQRAVLNWNWETFPEWMDHLRSLPKGVNTAMYLPMNPLLLYVKGEEVKSRPTTATERRQMRKLLHEAMDAGACGFSFTLLREGNSHVDFDGTPVPSDKMDPEDAYNLAWVLRERGEGVIQAMVEDRLDCRWEVSEQLARISARPIIHNVIVPYEPSSDHPTPTELRLTKQWRATLDWANELRSQGLKIFLQAAPYRAWTEFKIEDFIGFYSVPVFEDFGKCKTNDERMALASDPQWRQRAREAYKPEQFMIVGIPSFILGDVYGEPTYSKYVGKRVDEIAAAEDKPSVDVLFDILVATKMQADFRSGDFFWDTYSAEKIETIMRNPAALAGVSDGGAHLKTFTGGQWPNEFMNWMVKAEGRFTLEEAHQIMSQRPAEAFGFDDRGVLVEGYAADMMIYDFDKLGYDRKYVTLNDMPGGGYRRTVPARGVSHVLVNGEVIIKDGQTTGVHPGQVVSSSKAHLTRTAAA